MRVINRIVLFVLLAAFLQACTRQAVQWPPVSATPTGQFTPGRWVWADLVSDDPEQAKAFYGQVFGWQFSNAGSSDSPYFLVLQKKQPIAGISRFKKQAGSQRAARWIGLLSVESVAQASQSISKAGGKVHIPKKHLPGRGDFALASDPEGALFGLIRSDSGDPEDQLPGINNFFWRELWANDASAMAKFYRSFAHYEIAHKNTLNDVDEVYLSVGEKLRAGIIQVQHANISSAWLPYIRVANLKQALEKVRQAKGEILIAPSENVRKGMVAIIMDPQGAALGLVEWPEGMRGEMIR